MPVPTLMARRIKAYRHLAGWTQRDLSRKCGIARSTIGALECGSKTGFAVESLMKVAAALGVSMDLLARADVPGPVSVDD